jgi:hypothetical protein
MTFRWYWLDHMDEKLLAQHGCDLTNIKTIKVILERLKNNEKLSDLADGKVTRQKIIKIKKLYEGNPPKNFFSISSAYRLLLEGDTEASLLKKGFSKIDIQKAVQFRDEYEKRDMFSKIVAKEMEISTGAAKRMQEIFRDYQFNAF